MRRFRNQLLNQSSMTLATTYIDDATRGDRARPKHADPRHRYRACLREAVQGILQSEELPHGQRLLDFGCGTQPYRQFVARKFEDYIGADLPGNELRDMTIIENGTLPAEDGAFDCVLSSQVPEHVSDPAAYLAEAFRVLKPGGSLVLCTHGFWPYHADPNDLWRWTAEGLRLQIERAGFTFVEAKTVFGLTSTAIQLWQDATYGRCPRLIRPSYVWVLQATIGFIERRRIDSGDGDACVFVMLARKNRPAPAGSRSGLIQVASISSPDGGTSSERSPAR